jgi:hypothetical protein
MAITVGGGEQGNGEIVGRAGQGALRPPLLSTRLTRSLTHGEQPAGSRQLTGVAVA